MLTDTQARVVSDQLIEQAQISLLEHPNFICFTSNQEADALLNDLTNTPQASVIGCAMDRQTSAEQAWLVPYALQSRLGTIDVARLASMSEQALMMSMRIPTPLHRFPEKMGLIVSKAAKRIVSTYDGVRRAFGRTDPQAPLSFGGSWTLKA